MHREVMKSQAFLLSDYCITEVDKPPLTNIIIDPSDVNPSVPSSVDPISESGKKWVQTVFDAVLSDKSCKNQPEVIEQKRSWSKIEKVPEMLREVKANRGSYDPVVVSIGPYHHGKPELHFMEEHKLKMAVQYVNEDVKKLENLYQKVSHLAKDARKCYADQTGVKEFDKEEFDEEKFVQMMVLDACFILHFIDCFVNNKPEDLKMKSSMIPFVQRDLLLLENQIPFQVLEKLSDEFGDKGKKMDMLHNFVTAICNLSPTEETNKTTNKKNLSCFPFWGKECVKDGNGEAKSPGGNDKSAHDGNKPAHLLDFFRSYLFDKSAGKKNPQPKGKGSYRLSYRSAKELKAVGIHFRRSQTNKFTDVDFQSKYYCKSFLKLPQICIDDSTKSMLLNMVAHESSTNGPDDLGVSSYICFMDSLVDHAEDVMELRKKEIIFNFLGSDQQVADLFNELSENLVSHPHAYAEVKRGIDEHYKNRKKIWLAEWLNDHFSSPWTVLAFIGAILILSLSVIQTYESIKSSNS